MEINATYTHKFMCTYEDIRAFHTMQACMIFKYTIAIQPFVFNISLSII